MIINILFSDQIVGYNKLFVESSYLGVYMVYTGGPPSAIHQLPHSPDVVKSENLQSIHPQQVQMSIIYEIIKKTTLFKFIVSPNLCETFQLQIKIQKI